MAAQVTGTNLSSMLFLDTCWFALLNQKITPALLPRTIESQLTATLVKTNSLDTKPYRKQ
jgi:hypothetical protein